MATLGFEICLVVSIIVVIHMAARNYENINIYDWTIVLMVPIVVLGYWLKSQVTTPEAAEMAFCFIYLDSSVMLMVTVFAMLHAFAVRVNPWIKFLGYGTALAHIAVVWCSFGTKLYYATMTVTQTAAGSVTKMTSGPLKIIHVIYLAAVMFVIIAILIVAYLKKGTHSRRVLLNYSVIAVLYIIIYAVETLIDVDFTMLPYLYTLAVILIAINYDHTHMHDISSIISQNQKYFGKRGYIALDLQQRYMSCNEKAYDFVPFLREQRVDEYLPADDRLFSSMITQYHANGVTQKKFNVNKMTCICEISELSLRRDGKTQGYLFDIRDATEEQRAIDVMTSYNETLNAEIEKKTENIIDIQQKITVGMANIIENRDNNTGGHVKRTSDVIGILVDELAKYKDSGVDPELAEDIVRAAPMHDIGKISIDSNILCKPGRLTDEEYDIMKTHSTKSGEMVHILLDGVEEEHFVKTAFNIARYHHERWDGTGYPEGLVGTMIPLEARIMAVADVYDALVSKRCYKEPFSFEEARNIMLEGMGRQFDPGMEKVFTNCCEKLEDYYKSNLSQTE